MAEANAQTILKTFDLRRYAGLRDFGVAEWAHALSRRRGLLDVFDSFPKETLAGRMRAIWLDPLLIARREEVYSPAVTDISIYTAWCLRQPILSDPNLAAACEAEGEPVQVASAHEPGSDDWWGDLLAQSRDPKANRIHQDYNELGADHYDVDHVYVEVQLAAPDEVIIQHFKEWLARTRKKNLYQHSPKRRFTETELGRWVQNRVLPYLDITLMAQLLEVELPNHVIGALLFDGIEVDRAEKIRKTVAPLAEEVISYDLLEALAAAANAARLAERKESQG